MRWSTRARLWLAAIGLGVAAASAAQTFPNKPVHIVVPYTAGGATDAVARLVGQRMGEKLGQSVVVENKPGSSSNIGMAFVAKAPADGYTLLLVANSLATNNSLFANLPFDGLRDFAPIGRIASAPLLVAVANDSPVADFKTLLATARREPGKLSYATPGNGSSAHLAGEALKQAAHVDIQHIPYKGAAPALTDLIGGRIDFMPLNTVEASGHLKGQRVRALAVAAAKRVEMLPGVPTAAEAGLDGYVESVWYGFVAPAGTPPDVVARLNRTLQDVLAEPAMKQRLVDMGATPEPGSPQQFADFLRAERERAAKVVRLANIKPD